MQREKDDILNEYDVSMQGGDVLRDRKKERIKIEILIDIRDSISSLEEELVIFREFLKYR